MGWLFWIVMAGLAGGLALLFLNDAAGQTFGIENNDFAQMIVLAGFGVLVGSGLVARRIPLSEASRNTALWLLLALLLVAGYQYRYELQDVANRVSAGFVPGSPIAVVDAEGRESVFLERNPNGHFETRATVNGAPIRVLVDTGASATVLTAADAESAGFDLDALSYWVPVSTANGRTEAARVDAREVAVGPISRRDITLLVARPGALDKSLLGMNFIGSLSGFDMRGDRLILRD